ncbi:hypothetical protein HW114_14300 [Serratia symbiotica]|nr:relaxosome protein TraM [Serratia symbiotica]MBF1996543.1 hypothetical protein [Serratia symbiotica]MBQ0957222.1 relaxosome protein TraM [Serratia symbiotica]
MPRAQVYISKNTYKRIQLIVNEKKDDGADRTEANISSVAAMLLDIGLRVYEFQRKKELGGDLEDIDGKYDNGIPEPEGFNKMLMDNVLKTACASTILLQMVGNINEVKEMGLFNYDDMKERIKEKTNDKLEALSKKTNN